MLKLLCFFLIAYSIDVYCAKQRLVHVEHAAQVDPRLVVQQFYGEQLDLRNGLVIIKHIVYALI